MATVTSLAAIPDPGGVFTTANQAAINAALVAQNTNNTNINAQLNAAQPAQLAVVAVTASGAISPHSSQTLVLTKAGVAAMTLAAPTVTTDDGVLLTITSNTANAHTITATGLFQDGSTTTDVATFAARAGASVQLMAYQGKWNVISSTQITFS